MSQPIDATLHGRLALPEAASAEPIVRAAEPENAQTPAYRAKVTQAAEKFEGFFVNQILQQMRRSMRDIDPDEAANSKRGEDDMVDMADTLLADSLSHRHAFGVADAVLRQLLPASPRIAGPVDPRLPLSKVSRRSP